MKLYVSGPMTGLPEFNYPAFKQAAADLEAAGYEVSDPTQAVQCACERGSHDWSFYMQATLAQMLTSGARGVALLPGWDQSKGAQLESYIARSLFWPVESLEWWLDSPVKRQAWFPRSPSSCAGVRS